MTINDRILEILNLKKGATQKNMASSIGVATSTVNNWLKLGRSIPSEFIIPISEFLNVSCNYLLTGEEKNIAGICAEDIEWLNLIHQLPVEAQYEFRGEIKGYLKCLENHGSKVPTSPEELERQFPPVELEKRNVDG